MQELLHDSLLIMPHLECMLIFLHDSYFMEFNILQNVWIFFSFNMILKYYLPILLTYSWYVLIIIY